MPFPKFHQRFDLAVGTEEAKRRFVNRVFNYINVSVFARPLSKVQHLLQAVAYTLGEQCDVIPLPHDDIKRFLQGDFLRSLQALEGLYEALDDPMFSENEREELSDFICRLLEESEMDMGIRWEDGTFVRTGAQLLDEQLVNDPLKWLRADPSLAAVLIPFERGLFHFLQAEKNPNLLTDVINNIVMLPKIWTSG